MNARYKELETYFLSDRDSSKDYKSFAKDLAKSPEDISIIYQLNRHQNHTIAWRSAYMLDQIHDFAPEKVSKYFPEMIALIQKEKNQSILRHYTRILSNYDLSEQERSGDLVDRCLDLLVRESTAIAVKAHCMQIVFNMTKNYPELGVELAMILRELIPNGSSGIVSRAKKILKTLGKN